jgi:hypothetical protein
MLFVTSATLAVALILQPTASNVSSIPSWKTPPLEQPLPQLAKRVTSTARQRGSGTERPVRASQLSCYMVGWRAA